MSSVKIFLIVGVIGIALGFLLLLVPAPPSTDLTGFPKLKDATLAGRTIVDFGYTGDGTVAYSYLDAPVPEKIVENEVPELRRENSYTKFERVVEEGEDPVIELTTVFYTQPAYAQDTDGTWRYLEYATTTEQAFRNRDSTLWSELAELFVRTAYADSVSPFSGSGDGYVVGSDTGGGGNLSTCISFPSSGSATDNATTAWSLVFRTTAVEGSCEIDRIFLPFDTSAMPSNSSVSAASLSVYVTAKNNGDTTGDTVDLVSTSQASVTGLTTADYTSIGSSSGTSAPLDITAITTSAYNTFTFNSTGMGWIAFSGVASCGGSTGYTCIGIRDSHDIAGAGLTNGTTNSITISTSEQGGTSQDPQLSVTYSLVESAIVTSGLGISSGGLIIGSGGLRIY